MSYRSRMDARIRLIEAAAAARLWEARDTLTVETQLAAHDTGPWGRRIVRYDDHVYHPVVAISDDFSSATALVETPDGPITLQAGRGPLAEAWDAALSWRILRLLKGSDPVICEWLTVPRTKPPRGREPFWRRAIRAISPTIRIDDPLEIVRHDLAMRVLTTILGEDLRPDPHGTWYDLGKGVELRVHGRRVPRYSVVHPDEGSVVIPARLRRTYDEVLGERTLEAARSLLTAA